MHTFTLRFSDGVMTVDEAGLVTALTVGGDSLLAEKSPLFRFGIRMSDGSLQALTVTQGSLCQKKDGENTLSLTYAGFGGITVTVTLSVCDEALHAGIRAQNATEHMLEWVEVLPLVLPALRGEGGTLNGQILYPYNEGVLVDSVQRRQKSWFGSKEPKYPSHGSYPVFPNMICSQMMAYLYDGGCLYFGAHDKRRSVKAIDFRPAGSGVELFFRYYCGVDYGADYEADFPLVLRPVKGGWEAAAETYRSWFEKALPTGLVKIAEKDLPDWYGDSPFVVTYPVRGIHDMDAPMHPNALYPYTNALPLVDEIAQKTDARLLVLLMHWEGTAPWAPPYVWPPYGDPENFDRYLQALHRRGHLLGVYCSGFGYSMQSNLVDYSCAEAYQRDGLAAGMCAAPNGEVQISKICTAQRSGYDICPASEVGKSILSHAYMPLLTSNIDYAQILDQNHGGGQYFCYSKDHGHPPAPGAWMTENMQRLLGTWNDAAGETLLGCESAAAEPFIGNLLLSDNRFELCYHFGRPVPLYAYLYHEYVRNFMGNQVCCPLPEDVDTLRYRMAYSFSIGDCMTAVLRPDGQLMQAWGTRDFDHAPDKEKTLAFVANMTRFYRQEAKPYLYNGRMIEGLPLECDLAPFGQALPMLHTSAWEAEGKRVQILVNPFDEAVRCKLGGRALSVPANDAILLPI